LELLHLHEAPLTTEVAVGTSTLNLANADPSDGLIAASGKVFDLTLVTADQKLLAAQGIQVLANR
jgi:PIN domain nuclease of toxin-antitoxin system